MSSGEPTPSFNGGWDGQLGASVAVLSPERVELQLRVGPQHLQPFGLVHGGVHASLVETACSLGALQRCPPGEGVVGVEQTTSFLRPARSQDVLTARATPLHAGRRTQVWRCAVEDQRGRLVAHGQLRLMVVTPEGDAGA